MILHGHLGVVVAVSLMGCGAPPSSGRSSPESEPKVQKEVDREDLVTEIAQRHRKVIRNMRKLGIVWQSSYDGYSPRTPMCKARVPGCKDTCSIAKTVCSEAKLLCERSDSLGDHDWATRKCWDAGYGCKLGATKCCDCGRTDTDPLRRNTGSPYTL